MARYSSKNTDSKSSRNSQGSKGPVGGASSVALTSEQQEELDSINAELVALKQERDRVERRRGQVEDILDNFEQIAVGSLLVEVLPDEDADEIKNSLIVSKAEIFEELNIEADDINNNARKARAGNIIDKVFKLDIILELIDQSSILNENEMYITVLRDVIYDVEADDASSNQNKRAREKLLDVFDEFQNRLELISALISSSRIDCAKISKLLES